jgi:hypothetical protein
MKTPLIAALACTLFLTVKSASAENDFVVYSPYVVEGKSEIEMNAFHVQDARSNLNGAGGANISIAHAMTRWWKPEIYVISYNREPGEKSQPSGYEFENTFQLSAQGEYWADVGLLASYAHNRQSPNAAEMDLLFEKQSGHINQRLNLIWGKQIGAESSTAFRSAYRISYNIHGERATYAPGIEAYYRPGDHANQIGPVFSGELRTDKGSELEYSLGIVYKLNPGAPGKTLLARLAYEFF